MSPRSALLDQADKQYLWLQYAAFEEIDTKDFGRAREVYKAAIKLVPHKSFTFAKVCLLHLMLGNLLRMS